MENMDSDNCTDSIPTAQELFGTNDAAVIILVILAAILTASTVGIYIEEIVYILKASTSKRTEWTRPVWILGIYPVTAVTSLVSVCVPRSTTTNDFVASMYISICVVQFLKLIISYFGGREQLVAILANEKLKLRSPPCCCCCCCLPEITVSKNNIAKMNYMVLQVVVMRPLIFYCTTIYLSNIGQTSTPPSELTTTTSLLHMTSTLLAMYGLNLVYRVSNEHLQRFNITRKYRTLQLVLVFSNLQAAIFGLLASSGVFPCTPGGFTSKSRASNAHHTILIFEMFLLSLVARYFYRRKEPIASFHSYIKEQLVENDVLQKETDKVNYGSNQVTDAVLGGLEDSVPGNYNISSQKPHTSDIVVNTDGPVSIVKWQQLSASKYGPVKSEENNPDVSFFI